MTIAAAPVKVRGPTGRRRTVTLFEAAVEKLASGQTSRRRSPIRFIRLALECSREPPPQQPARQEPDTVQIQMELRRRRLLEMIDATNSDAEFEDAFARYRALFDMITAVRR